MLPRPGRRPQPPSSNVSSSPPLEREKSVHFERSLHFPIKSTCRSIGDGRPSRSGSPSRGVQDIFPRQFSYTDFFCSRLAMSDSNLPQAATDDTETEIVGASPSSSSSAPQADCADDPEIVELLKFDPAPRLVKRPDGWTAERQRCFIRLIVETGSPQRAAAAMGKKLSGLEQVYRSEGAEGFREAWDRAVAMAAERETRRLSRIG